MASPLFTCLLSPLLNIVLSPSSIKYELERTITQPIKQIARRSSIRGFKDDYYHVESDVVLLAGETHAWRKPVRIAPHYLFRTCLHGQR